MSIVAQVKKLAVNLVRSGFELRGLSHKLLVVIKKDLPLRHAPAVPCHHEAENARLGDLQDMRREAKRLQKCR
jgi:hypothetical protein